MFVLEGLSNEVLTPVAGSNGFGEKRFDSLYFSGNFVLKFSFTVFIPRDCGAWTSGRECALWNRWISETRKKNIHTICVTVIMQAFVIPCWTQMKAINPDLYCVVLKGEIWQHNIAPCSKGAIYLLANNESVVTWLSPKDRLADCTSHIPVILFKDKYWTLSLRMSKCIYRHIRLRKGFHNIQNVHGVQTLRIPQLLLNEKKRTQARFEVILFNTPVSQSLLP